MVRTNNCDSSLGKTEHYVYIQKAKELVLASLIFKQVIDSCIINHLSDLVELWELGS